MRRLPEHKHMKRVDLLEVLLLLAVLHSGLLRGLRRTTWPTRKPGSWSDRSERRRCNRDALWNGIAMPVSARHKARASGTVGSGSEHALGRHRRQ
jgi:hypothetical protein